MTNALYNIAGRKMLTGQFDWTAVDLMLVAWGGTATFTADDETIADVKAYPGVVELGYSLPIIGKTVSSNAVAQSDNVLIPGIGVGSVVTWFTLCVRDATVHDNSELVFYLDDVEGLPFTGNGLDLPVQPDWAEQRGWFKLG